MTLSRTLLVLGLFVGVGRLGAEEPCRSGLRVGQKPGPYSAVISTGPQRGQSYCYVCETAERPAVVIFARSLSDGLGRLAARLDQAVAEHKKEDLRAWITFLHEDQLQLDPQVVAWSQKHALRNIPLGVFEDAGGPPSYRLAADADVTILFFVKQKVTANYAFRSGQLTDKRIEEILQALPGIVSVKK